MQSYDVVVLGTGAAGLCAALAAASAGARVGLFEKGEQVGGTTALASAVVPPTFSPFSNSPTRAPPEAADRAAHSPAAPVPRTTTS